jgi:hypothetical protein
VAFFIWSIVANSVEPDESDVRFMPTPVRIDCAGADLLLVPPALAEGELLATATVVESPAPGSVGVVIGPPIIIGAASVGVDASSVPERAPDEPFAPTPSMVDVCVGIALCTDKLVVDVTLSSF